MHRRPFLAIHSHVAYETYFYSVVCMYTFFSIISLLYAQMQAHMMSHEMVTILHVHDVLGLRGQQAMDNLSQSLCCYALHLFRQVSVLSTRSIYSVF